MLPGSLLRFLLFIIFREIHRFLREVYLICYGDDINVSSLEVRKVFESKRKKLKQFFTMHIGRDRFLNFDSTESWKQENVLKC